MKLWVFNHYAVSPSVPGGTRHYDFSRRLVDRGWDVTIFASGFNHQAGCYDRTTDDKPVVVEIIDGVRFVWLRTRAYHRNDMSRILSMFDYVKYALAVGRGAEWELPLPDVVLGCSVHPLAAWAASRVARCHGARFLLELRDLWPQSLIEMGTLSRYHPAVFFLRLLETTLLRHAEGIVVLSPRAKDYLISRGVSGEIVHLIPNGINLADHVATPVTERGSAPFTVMYLGAHGVANQLDVVVEAAHLLAADAGVRFIFVGEGPEKNRLMAVIQKQRLQNVTFLDAVKKSDVPATLAGADALILTEAQNVYGSSNKLFDYLAAARPLILSTHATHNLAMEAECGFVIKPGDATALANAVTRMRDLDADVRWEMGVRGRRYVEVNNDWDVLIERLVDVLDGKTRPNLSGRVS